MFHHLLIGMCCLLPTVLAAAQMPVLDFDPPPRRIKMDPKKTITLTGKNFEIVVPAEAGKPAMFAGKELQTILSKVLSAKIPLRSSRSTGVPHAIILGDSALSRKAGIKVDKLGRDAFLMKTIGKDIYIAGRDEKSSDTEKLLDDRSWQREPFLHHRATLFGAYDFLERFADVRFYFTGPYGTLSPKKASLKVPALDIFDRPDNIVRSFPYRRFVKKQWYTDTPIRDGNLAALRMRLHTRNIPNCHGISYLGYVARFGKTNPEFFALKKDGTRYNTWKDDFPGQLCLSNPGFRNELFKDAVSALRGEPPTKRGVVFAYKGYQKGISMWAPSVYYPGFFNVHLQDGCQPCHCADCQKAYKSGKPGTMSGELIWEMTADIANRVKKAGLNAYITQMAYHFYRDVPKIDLPDNVLVQVATAGPWAMPSATIDQHDRQLLRDWKKKLGKRVWLWNYMLNSNTSENTYSSPGIPHYSPKAVGRYYHARRNEICGAFLNTTRENDYIHEAMNVYMYMKILWNTTLDIDQLMDEYYKRMFTAAAPEMKKFFEDLESLWTTKMRGQFIETDLGPVSLKPTEFETWNKIYTPEKLSAWEKLFNKAEKKLAKDKDALARVRFMRKHFLDFMLTYSKKFRENEKRSNQLIAYAAPVNEKPQPLYLSRMHDRKTEVKANVTVQNDGDAFLIRFRAEAPNVKELRYNPRKGDFTDFFTGATFEIYLNPSRDRKTVYQIAVAPSGTWMLVTYPGTRKGTDPRIQVQTSVAADHWTATVRVPFTCLPWMHRNGFPANFSYNHQRKTARNFSELYSWSPWLLRGFFETDHYGQLSLEKIPYNNLISNFDFQGVKRGGNVAGKWTMLENNKALMKVTFSPDHFISGGQSLTMIGTNAKGSCQIGQNLRGQLKPDTKYRFSYYVRYDLDKEAIVRGRVWSTRNHFFPRQGSKGKSGWKMVTGEFKTGKMTPAQIKRSHIGFSLHGKGTAWIDHVVLQEVKE